MIKFKKKERFSHIYLCMWEFFCKFAAQIAHYAQVCAKWKII
jgi:hypothetical protein